MPQKKETPIQRDLKDWALWVETQLSGYPKTVTIARAMSGQLTGGTFGPTNPNIDASQAWMRRLIIAMANLQATKKARYVRATQLYYLFGPKKIAEILGRPSSTLKDWRRWGEDLIEKELKGSR